MRTLPAAAISSTSPSPARFSSPAGAATITDATSIQGSTAPGWTAAPVVEINCNGFGGLQIGAGVTGGAISTVAIVNASGAGVTLNGDNASVTGNYIGVGLNGTTAMPNSGDGLEVVSSDGNTISGNVISGNQGNGIDLNSSADNLLTNNFVGTNAAGTAPGNGQNWVLITALAAGNTLGAVGQPNVISGNSANGVLINSGLDWEPRRDRKHDRYERRRHRGAR